MGGLVIDIVVVFLAKSVYRAVLVVRSRRWERVEARVVESASRNPDMGCSFVQVHYRFGSNHDTLEDLDEIPFMLRTDAEAYARRLVPNTPIVVRVNPGDARDTHMFRHDQHGWKELSRPSMPGDRIL